VAVILARGGSKGLINKNLRQICKVPLLVWTIEQCLAGGIDEVFVSSDSSEILECGAKYGAELIVRPEQFASDSATSEIAWLHAINVIESHSGKIDWVFAPQVTSPLREPSDIQRAIEVINSGNFDSLFSCSEVSDLFVWEEIAGQLQSLTYDWKDRKRRQDISKRFVENGSFYAFKPELLRQNTNRLGGRIGRVEMDGWKSQEIDSADDLNICEVLMKAYLAPKFE